MIAPVTGPLQYVENFGSFYRVRQRYKQAKPFTLPLPYSLLVGEKIGGTGNIANNPVADKIGGIDASVLDHAVTNQTKMFAYERLKSAITDRAQLGESLLEFRKSLSTIENRAMQLFDFTRAVKRGRFVQAASILRTPLPRNRHPVKEAGNNWLEYHLGIEPVIRDIYTAVDHLQQPIKNVMVRARASSPEFKLMEYTTTAPWSKTFKFDRVKVDVQYQVEVAVSNPNLWLANSLGVLNPVQVAWQAVPLTFVVDWFVNVESFLGSATDFLGLTTLNPQTMVKFRGKYLEFWTTYGWVYSANFFGMRRALGLSLPSLGFRPYKATSWQRGLTAMSLLVGGLKSLDPQTTRRKARQPHLFEFQKNQKNVVAAPYDWKSERRSRGDL